MLISEADSGGDPSKEDGMVDYEEFVDFSADLLITLRAREHGKMMMNKTDAVMDGNIRGIMHKQVRAPSVSLAHSRPAVRCSSTHALRPRRGHRT